MTHGFNAHFVAWVCQKFLRRRLPIACSCHGSYHASSRARLLVGLKLSSTNNMLNDLAVFQQTGLFEEVHALTDQPYDKGDGRSVFHYLPKWIACLPILRVVARCAKLFKVAREVRPSLIYVYHLTAFGIGGLLVGGTLGIPVVLHLLGNDLDIYLKYRGFRFWFMPVLRRFDRLSVQGSASHAVLEKLGLNEVFEFPTACQLPEEKKHPGFGERDISVVFVGRIAEEKRLDRFLDIVQQAAKVMAVPPLNVVVLGDGPLRSEMEWYARSLNTPARIHFAGWQNNVHEWLRRAKIFVLSSDRDQLPLSLLEAMSVGAVPAVTRVGNLADVVDERVGLCFERTQTESAADWIAGVLKDEAMWKLKSQACMQRVREFSVPQVAGRMRAVLQEMMK